MNLKNFFDEHPKAALAFSRSAESAYLLYAALKCGADIQPYFVNTQFHPRFEEENTRRLCAQMGVQLSTIQLDILSVAQITRNAADRCYYCKKAVFSAVREQACKDGYDIVIDGTNALESVCGCPWTSVLHELGILSPLQLCGITRKRVKELSAEAGLITPMVSGHSCLACRIPTGTFIRINDLNSIEECENILYRLGFTDFCVSVREGNAILQFTPEQRLRAIKDKSLLHHLLGDKFGDIEIACIQEDAPKIHFPVLRPADAQSSLQPVLFG